MATIVDVEALLDEKARAVSGDIAGVISAETRRTRQRRKGPHVPMEQGDEGPNRTRRIKLAVDCAAGLIRAGVSPGHAAGTALVRLRLETSDFGATAHLVVRIADEARARIAAKRAARAARLAAEPPPELEEVPPPPAPGPDRMAPARERMRSILRREPVVIFRHRVE